MKPLAPYLPHLNRRELLRIGGLSVLGGLVSAFRPSNVMKNLPGVLDKVTVVRSLAAWDAVHGRAQYYVQSGHPLNLALAKEVPAVGAVVCYELAKQRKESDSLPPYIPMNIAGHHAGLIKQR